jgi:hypothetical protein
VGIEVEHQYLIAYAYNVGDSGGPQRIQNAVIDKDPLDWLLEMRVRHASEDYQLLMTWNLLPADYERLRGKVG